MTFLGRDFVVFFQKHNAVGCRPAYKHCRLFLANSGPRLIWIFTTQQRKKERKKFLEGYYPGQSLGSGKSD